MCVCVPECICECAHMFKATYTHLEVVCVYMLAHVLWYISEGQRINCGNWLVLSFCWVSLENWTQLSGLVADTFAHLVVMPALSYILNVLIKKMLKQCFSNLTY